MIMLDSAAAEKARIAAVKASGAPARKVAKLDMEKEKAKKRREATEACASPSTFAAHDLCSRLVHAVHRHTTRRGKRSYARG